MTGHIKHQPSAPADDRLNAGLRAWLAWHVTMGMTDLEEEGWPAGSPAPRRPVAEAPARAGSPAIFQAGPSRPAPAPAARRPGVLRGDREAVADARRLAAACGTLDDIRAALEGFDGCRLRDTAARLCFADGSPHARVMVIGEAPDSEDDLQGLPFAGPSGQLLDRMLGAIGLDRGSVWITNAVFWRPPGNRTPSAGETAVCRPFLERQVEILAPAAILFLGGLAARVLLERTDGVTRLRGHRYACPAPRLEAPVPALVTFHPADLLRRPLSKGFAWRDLLTLDSWLAELGNPHRH